MIPLEPMLDAWREVNRGQGVVAGTGEAARLDRRAAETRGFLLAVHGIDLADPATAEIVLRVTSQIAREAATEGTVGLVSALGAINEAAAVAIETHRAGAGPRT